MEDLLMKAALQISVRFVMVGTAFLTVFFAAFVAATRGAGFLDLIPVQASAWLPVFVLVSLGVPGVVATFAARLVDRRVLVSLRESGLPASIRRKLASLLILGYVGTAVFGSPAALTTGHREALEGYLEAQQNRSVPYHLYIAGYAAVPVLPGIVLTYEEYQTGMRAGFGGFRLYAWYGKDTVCLGSVPFWLS
jgi:hypothetical protein